MTRVSGRFAADGEVDVSVLLITCNHAAFIERAVGSVLSQRTGRSFELIISEDASTDGTREIVEQLAATDSRIRPIFSATNLRSNETVRRAVEAARGRYLCLLDGDDQWIADDKIERQAALLDSSPDVSACFHNALVVHGSAGQADGKRWTPPGLHSRIGFAELWEGDPFATCAGMLRRSALDGLGSWYVDCFPVTDWPLYLLCAEKGELAFADEPVGLYRLHSQGAVSGLAERDRFRLMARFYRQMTAVPRSRWPELARSGGSLYFTGHARKFMAEANRPMARFCLRLALGAGGVGRSVSWRAWLGLLRRSFV